MTQIKVLGTGCSKCKTTYNNVLEALKQLNMEAEVIKVEDIEEMMKYNVLRKEDAQHEQNQRIAERKEYNRCGTCKRIRHFTKYAYEL